MRKQVFCTIITILIFISVASSQVYENYGVCLGSTITGIKVKDSHAYCFANYGIEVFNVSNPDSIYKVGSSVFPLVEAISPFSEFYQDYLYVSRTDLHIFDISNPSQVTLVNSIDTPGYAGDICISENYCFMAAGSSGLLIYDLTNPTEPVIAGVYLTNETSISRVFVQDSIVYALCLDQDSEGLLKTINISDPSNPQLLGEVLSWGDIICADNGLGLVGRGVNGVDIIDVSDPSDPIWLSNYNSEPSPYIIHNIFNIQIEDNIAYMAYGDGGFQLVSLANPINPQRIWNSNDINIKLAIQDDLAYTFKAGNQFAFYPNTLDIYNISSNNPSLAGQYEFFNRDIMDFCAQGNYVYAVTEDYGLQIADISNPSLSRIISGCETINPPEAISIFDDYAYITLESSGFEIIDVTNPHQPVSVGYNSESTGNNNLKVYENYLYRPSEQDGLKIYDVSSPYNPFLVETYLGSGNIYDIALQGNYAFLCAETELEVLNTSDINNIIIISEISCIARKVEIHYNYLYTSIPFGDLNIIDIQDPYNPTKVNLDTLIPAHDFYLSDDYLVTVRDGDFSDIFFYSLTDNTNPVLIDSIHVSGYPRMMFYNDNIMFVYNEWAIMMYHLEDTTDVEEEDEDPEEDDDPEEEEPDDPEIPPTPTTYSLAQNYPNPFNAQTKINYALPQSGHVIIDIYDILGRKVSTPLDRYQTAGEKSITWDADGFSSGVYFYRLTAGDQEFIGQMTLVK